MLPVKFDFVNKQNKRQSVVQHNIAVLQQYNNIVKQRSIRLRQLIQQKQSEQVIQQIEPEPVIQEIEPEKIYCGFKFGKI